MFLKQIIKQILFFMSIFAALIFGCKISNNIICVKAAETEIVSEECQIIHFSDGSSLNVWSTPTEVIIKGTHVNSKAKISYETTGYTVTKRKTDGMVESVPYFPVKLISKSEVIGSEVETTYRLDRRSIFDGLYMLYRKTKPSLTDAEALAWFRQYVHDNSGLDFYLHDVFCVIKREGGSGSAVISRSGTYRNLGTPVGASKKTPGILNAVMDLFGVDWSEQTKKKLKEYYDIHLRLYMAPCLADVVLSDEDGNILCNILKDERGAQYVKMGFSIPKQYQGELEFDGVKYKLTQKSVRKSYVCYGADMKREQEYSLVGDEGLKVRLQSGELEYMQLFAEKSTVFLVCEKIEEQNEKPGGPVIEETEGTYRISMFEPKPEIEISAWEQGNPLFTVDHENGGIPVNEYIYIKTVVPDFLLDALFAYKEGEVTVDIPVRRTYQLNWREIVGEDEDGIPIYENFSDTITRQSYVPVTREYRYIELVQLEYYYLSNILVINETLEKGELECEIGGGMLEQFVQKPLLWEHFDGESLHLQEPEEFETGIVLETVSLYSENGVPSIPTEDFSVMAEEMVGEFLVRDDYFSFLGNTYLSGEFVDYDKDHQRTMQEIFGQIQQPLYEAVTEKLLIPENIENGIHESCGEIRYKRAESISKIYPEIVSFEPEAINPVYIHTPVYCEGILDADNKKFCQLVSPEDSAVMLVPDEEGISGDLIVTISNTGKHSEKQGYGTRDYSKTLGSPDLSYLARNDNGVLRNEVQFPFDVYLDVGKNQDPTDDILYAANEWIAVGKDSARFYLPLWVEEGIFEVNFRSVAVNSSGYEEFSEENRNTQMENYIATASALVQVSGKIFGLKIKDITDYPLWESVFKTGEDYSVGTKDEYGRSTKRNSLYTLPVCEGSHPSVGRACYKPGYLARFQLSVTGTALQRNKARIEVVPRFFYLDESGGQREEVLLYTVRRIGRREYLVRAGDLVDLKNAVNSKGTYPPYSYGGLRLECSGIGGSGRKIELDFEYSLPYRLYIVNKGIDIEKISRERGIDFTEEFWKKKGYLVVNFEITGYVSEKPYLSYKNSGNDVRGYCNMWRMEGQVNKKQSQEGTKFQLAFGDILVIPLGSSIQKDYIAGGIY